MDSLSIIDAICDVNNANNEEDNSKRMESEADDSATNQKMHNSTRRCVSSTSSRKSQKILQFNGTMLETAKQLFLEYLTITNIPKDLFVEIIPVSVKLTKKCWMKLSAFIASHDCIAKRRNATNEEKKLCKGKRERFVISVRKNDTYTAKCDSSDATQLRNISNSFVTGLSSSSYDSMQQENSIESSNKLYLDNCNASSLNSRSLLLSKSDDANKYFQGDLVTNPHNYIINSDNIMNCHSRLVPLQSKNTSPDENYNKSQNIRKCLKALLYSESNDIAENPDCSDCDIISNFIDNANSSSTIEDSLPKTENFSQSKLTELILALNCVVNGNDNETANDGESKAVDDRNSYNNHACISSDIASRTHDSYAKVLNDSYENKHNMIQSYQMAWNDLLHRSQNGMNHLFLRQQFPYFSTPVHNNNYQYLEDHVNYAFDTSNNGPYIYCYQNPGDYLNFAKYNENSLIQSNLVVFPSNSSNNYPNLPLYNVDKAVSK